MMDGRELGTPSIVLATEDQLPELIAFAALSPDAPHWPVVAWGSFLDAVQAGKAVRRSLFTLRQGREIAGVMAVAVLPGVTELELLLVRPSSRRQGIGRALARHWLQWAFAIGAQEAVLEVRASNVAAQDLYRALGFERQGVRSRYYKNPPEDALLLHCDLARNPPESSC